MLSRHSKRYDSSTRMKISVTSFTLFMAVVAAKLSVGAAAYQRIVPTHRRPRTTALSQQRRDQNYSPRKGQLALPLRDVSKTSTRRKTSALRSPKRHTTKLRAAPIETTNKASAWDRPSQQTEMIGMTAAGLAFSSAVLVTLAMKDGESLVLRGFELDSMGGIADNIIDAAFPLSTTDVVSVALGEVFAGLIGAVAAFSISATLRWQRKVMTQNQPKLSVADAVADGDFFVAKAGAFPLFEALGFSPILASVASVAIAIVPNQLIKLGSYRRQQKLQENVELERLLREQQEKSVEKTGSFALFSQKLFRSKTPDPPSTVDPSSLKPVTLQKDTFVVETFADITKWLEYDILSNEYGGKLLFNGLPLFTGFEGAIFGTLAAVSAQMYADLLYCGFGWGGEERRQQVLSRTISEWSAAYLFRCIASAALFGVFQTAQVPARVLISSFLSGSVDGCIGSEYFDTCNEAYLTFNPPPRASVEAELRALASALYSLWSRFVPSV
ncbi:predicted protein [Phaeodactylum tricornutum CCAP 1055/1]|uniref:Uncharacterized protein n=1 Tax=Phaeodactylum tricornutum (strain CCAP 1055/1) TaxID=556484 RepID=B7FSP1_PHATC|nr:predicted protein [Phaeodactylum tricornutum CCAP 1055/1]EEC50512.1 predicted protein [Phaeodactylum tricornutum CCAP 1055/1]|eukprot:XP_002177698.1 predicted protein [Phaeodactylum tricornutum CCAP 1055/1]